MAVVANAHTIYAIIFAAFITFKYTMHIKAGVIVFFAKSTFACEFLKS
jgi:hypothetical protein